MAAGGGFSQILPSLNPAVLTFLWFTILTFISSSDSIYFPHPGPTGNPHLSPAALPTSPGTPATGAETAMSQEPSCNQFIF